MANLAQRRGAKAVRRRDILKARRKAERADPGAPKALGGGELPANLPPYNASAALLHVAEHLTDENDDRDSLYKKLKITMFAWNMSLLPLDERKQQMQSFSEKAMQEIEEKGDYQYDRAESWSWFAEALEALIERKNALYPSDIRYMTDLEIVGSPTEPRVNVTFDIDPEA